jgi:hypothetical protein
VVTCGNGSTSVLVTGPRQPIKKTAVAWFIKTIGNIQNARFLDVIPTVSYTPTRDTGYEVSSYRITGMEVSNAYDPGLYR